MVFLFHPCLALLFLLLPALCVVLAVESASPSFPPAALNYHAQGGDFTVIGANEPRMSPDGRFLCHAAAAASRGFELQCWRLAPADSSDPLVLRTGLLDDGALIRAPFAFPGTANVLRDLYFRSDGGALVVAMSAPARLWLWDRDAVTGKLSGQREIYTLSTATSSFSPYYTSVRILANNIVLAFGKRGEFHHLRVSPDAVTHSDFDPEDARSPPGQLSCLVITRDERCIYTTGGHQFGLGYWSLEPMNATDTLENKLGPFTEVQMEEDASMGYGFSSLLLSTDPSQSLLWSIGQVSTAVFERDVSGGSCALRLIAINNVGLLPEALQDFSPVAGTLLPDQRTLIIGSNTQGGAWSLFGMKFLQLQNRSAEEIQHATDEEQAFASLPQKLVDLGHAPAPLGVQNFLFPALSTTRDDTGQPARVFMASGGGQMYSVSLAALRDRLTNDSDVLLRGWDAVAGPDPNVTANVVMVQAGFTTDVAYAVTTADARFLYSNGGVTDLFAFKLDPLTGRRIDGGRRFATEQSLEEQRVDFPYVADMTRFSSVALSADPPQRFLYAAGKELHALVRDNSTGALSNRTVFPLAPLGESGSFGVPVARSDPFPHLLIPDGLSLRQFATDPLTGAVQLPEGGGNGTVFSLPPDLTAISALAVDRTVVYVGGGRRSLTVLRRIPASGVVQRTPALQVLQPGDVPPDTAVIGLLTAAGFVYSFDNAGGLLVHTRASNGDDTLAQLQTVAAPLSGSAYTAAVALWENSAQSLVVAVLSSSNIIVFRRNVLTGLLDTPTRLVPAGQSEALFHNQGVALSAAVAAGTVYVTAANVALRPAAVMIELQTGNYVLPSASDGGTGNGTEDEQWAAQWGIDWQPAMRLQLRLEGSPLDGTFLSYRPDVSANLRAFAQPNCLQSILMPRSVVDISPSSSADACMVEPSPPNVSTPPCSAIITTLTSQCNPAQQIRQMKTIGSGLVLFTAPNGPLAAVDAADPGRTDSFYLNDTESFYETISAYRGTISVAFYLSAEESQLLRSFIDSCGGRSDCSEAGATLAFPSSTMGESMRTDDSDTIWRIAAATSWRDERIGLRQFLPADQRGTIPAPATGFRSTDERLNLLIPTPSACWSSLPGVWCEGGVIVSISWVGWQGTIGNGSVPDLWAGLTGSLQSLRLVDSPLTGALPASFCLLRRLRYFHVERSFLTALPDCFGPEHMPTLEHFHVSESRIAAGPPPSLARAQRLQWLTFAHNGAEGGAASSGGVSLEKKPLLPDLSGLSRLVLLNLSSAGLSGDIRLLRCASWSRLHVYSVDGNALRGALTGDWFDGLSQLRVVSLSGAALSGPFPSLLGCTGLLSLSLSGCGLSGAAPVAWGQLTLLSELDVSGNALTLPTLPLSGLTSLRFLDLSSNRLQCSEGRLDPLLQSLPVSLQTLRLDGNPLKDCRWQSAVDSLRNSPLLQALTASRTGLRALPADLLAPALPWRSLDFSSCALEAGLSERYAPSSLLLALSLTGNPSLPPLSPRPSWLRLDASTRQQSAGELFSCPQQKIAQNPAASLQLPASVTGYEQCACVQGTFGTPPDCRPQIAELRLSQGQGQQQQGAGNGSAEQEEQALAQMLSTVLPSLDAPPAAQLMALTVPDSGLDEAAAAGAGWSTAATAAVAGSARSTDARRVASRSGVLLPSSVGAPAVGGSVRSLGLRPSVGGTAGTEGTEGSGAGGSSSPPVPLRLAHGSVSDAWFGSARATPGVNSDFVVSAPAGTRVTRLVVLLNRYVFTARSDVLTVSGGAGVVVSSGGGAVADAASGAVVLQGDAVSLPLIDLCGAGNASALLLAGGTGGTGSGGGTGTGTGTGTGSASESGSPAAVGAALLLSSAVSGAPVQNSSAYLSSLRSSLGSVCSASVWSVDVFGSGATLNFRSARVGGVAFAASWTASALCPAGLEADPQSAACLRRYALSPSVQRAVLAAAVALGAALLCCGAVLFLHRSSAVVRAASLFVPLSLLLCLLALCCGAVLYTVPPAWPSDDRPCVARAWLTLLPLSLILSALFARAEHVTAIFRSQALQTVSRTGHLARWLLGATAAELALLLAFTLRPLGGAALRTQSSLPGQLVLECGGRQGFWAWFGVQLGFLLLVLLQAARVAWRARRLPVLFNDANTLFNGLVVLALCGATVLPAALGVAGTAVPEAAQAVQAFGQLMLVALWAATLIGPKIVLIWREQQSAKVKKALPLPLSIPVPLVCDSKNFGEAMASTLPKAPPAGEVVAHLSVIQGLEDEVTTSRSAAADRSQLPPSFNPMSGFASPMPRSIAPVTAAEGGETFLSQSALQQVQQGSHLLPGHTEPLSSIAGTQGSTPRMSDLSDVSFASPSIQPQPLLPPLHKEAMKPVWLHVDRGTAVTPIPSPLPSPSVTDPAAVDASLQSATQGNGTHIAPTARRLLSLFPSPALLATSSQLAQQRRAVLGPLARALQQCAAEWRSATETAGAASGRLLFFHSSSVQASPHSQCCDSTATPFDFDLQSPSAREGMYATGTALHSSADTSTEAPSPLVGPQWPSQRATVATIPLCDRQQIYRAAAVYLRGVDAAISAALSSASISALRPLSLSAPTGMSSTASTPVLLLATAAETAVNWHKAHEFSLVSLSAVAQSIPGNGQPSSGSTNSECTSPLRSSVPLTLDSGANWLLLTSSGVLGVLMAHQWSALSVAGMGFSPIVRQLLSMAEDEASAEARAIAEQPGGCASLAAAAADAAAAAGPAPPVPTVASATNDGSTAAPDALVVSFIAQLQADLAACLEQATLASPRGVALSSSKPV